MNTFTWTISINPGGGSWLLASWHCSLTARWNFDTEYASCAQLLIRSQIYTRNLS